MLKVDVEAAEWPFLRSIVDIESAQSDYITQLLMELHTPRFAPQPLSKTDLLEIIHYMTRLSERGFTVFHNRQKNFCCAKFSALMPDTVTEKCCYETFYVNMRFLQSV